MTNMHAGLQLWQRALRAIPGGNGLLSKRPERYAPDIWPTYFRRAKGVEVWDLEGKRYVDMAQMGLGSAILGYTNDEVDAAVRQAIDAGVNTTLNAPEEVYLAERLLELNPFAGGVKFARTGGEAMAIAVRIARAASGKDKVAISGYHGWTDWYLAANLTGDNNLSDHLLPGLKPKGVPRGLQQTVFPFQYNHLDEFEAIVAQHDIGVVVLEGARYDYPTPGFMHGVARVARQRGIVLVVDEITSGWRVTDGGVYKLLGYEPDIVVYGKAMGNGFAIAAVVGRTAVMDEAQETFMSSTFWTERVGFVAGLATIETLVRRSAWEHLIAVGTMISQGWEAAARACDLRLHVTEFKPLVTFKLEYGEQNGALLTLFTQEMLHRGYLAASSVYVSYAHQPAMVREYLQHVREVFAVMAEAIAGQAVNKRLVTAVRQEGFRRLT